MNEPIKTGFLASLGVAGGIASITAVVSVVGVLALFCVIATLCGGCLYIGSAPVNEDVQRKMKQLEEQQEASRKPLFSEPSLDATDRSASETSPPAVQP